MWVGEGPGKVNYLGLPVLTLEATSLTSKGQIFPGISPQTLVAGYPSSLGSRRILWWASAYPSKCKEKGLAVVPQTRKLQPRFLPETRSLFSRAGVDTGTDTSSMRHLWSPPLVNMPPFQAVHTHWVTTHSSTPATQERLPGKWLPHTEDEERNSGDAHDLLGLGTGACGAGFPLPQRAGVGRLCTRFELAYFWSLFKGIFITGNQVRHTWS